MQTGRRSWTRLACILAAVSCQVENEIGYKKTNLRMKTGRRPLTRLEMTALPVPCSMPLGSRSNGLITSLHTSRLRFACKNTMQIEQGRGL